MTSAAGKRRVREPEITREKLLTAAFEEIYLRGFQGASLDTILTKAGVTKGALYHHFTDKASLGYAVVDEVVKGFLLMRWLGRLDECDENLDPLCALQEVLRYRAANCMPEEIECGCPLNNLAQEMSPLDEAFRQHIDAVFDAWVDGFAQLLERGQREGCVRLDVDARKMAGFIVAAVEGSFGLAKNAKSESVLRSNLEVLSLFLDGLRPDREGTPA